MTKSSEKAKTKNYKLLNIETHNSY